MNPTANILLDLLHIISGMVDGFTSKDDLKSYIKLVEERILKLNGESNGI